MPRIANRTNCRFSHEDPDDPHKSFVLSRFCAGFPLINHIMRSTGYIPELEEFDLTIRECLEGIFLRTPPKRVPPLPADVSTTLQRSRPRRARPAARCN